MNPNKKPHIVNAGDTRFLAASLNYQKLQPQDMITWKKKVYSKGEVQEKPLRLLFAIEDNGDIHYFGKELSTNYKFTKQDVGKYIKFYSYCNKFNTRAQCIVFYVEGEHDTDVRITDVERIGSDSIELHVGEKIKLRTKFSLTEDRVSSKTREYVKWMVRVDGEEERLIIDGLVMTGREIEFAIPEDWVEKEVVLMPFLSTHTSTVCIVLHVGLGAYCFYHNPPHFVFYNEERYLEKTKQITDEYHKENSKFIDQQVDFYFEDRKYTANSYATLFGRDGYIGEMGGFKYIYSVERNILLSVLAQAAYVFYDYGIRNPLEVTVLNESVSKKNQMQLLDYKFEFFKFIPKDFNYVDANDLVMIDNIVYNANELGNYLWGMVLEYYGVLIDSQLIAELGTRGRKDEPWEQRAIKNGKRKANVVNVTNIEKEYILNQRLEYRLLYSDQKDTEWRKINLKK